MVRHSVAGMQGAGNIEFPGKVYSHRAGGLPHVLEAVPLLLAFEFIFHRYPMNGHFLVRSLVLVHGFQEFHEREHDVT